MSATEKSLLQESFTALLRVTLGCVFVFASVDKIIDPNAFAASIGNYKIIYGTTTEHLATILPWVELLCGIGLVLGIFARGSALLTLSMLVVFTVLVVSAIARGLDISCGCFTQDPSAGRIGWSKVGENVGLIVVNILVMIRTDGRFSLDHVWGIHHG